VRDRLGLYQFGLRRESAPSATFEPNAATSATEVRATANFRIFFTIFLLGKLGFSIRLSARTPDEVDRTQGVFFVALTSYLGRL
jgi:hypothetical protein